MSEIKGISTAFPKNCLIELQRERRSSVLHASSDWNPPVTGMFTLAESQYCDSFIDINNKI